MSASAATTDWEASTHLLQKLKSKQQRTERGLDPDVLLEVIDHGDVKPELSDTPSSEGRVWTVDGVTFTVIVNPVNKVIVTAFPSEIDRFEAITSNRWTQSAIDGIEQFLR